MEVLCEYGTVGVSALDAAHKEACFVRGSAHFEAEIILTDMFLNYYWLQYPNLYCIVLLLYST